MTEPGVLRLETRPGAPVLVAFGGIAGAFGMPAFEFRSLLTRLGVSAVLVRDLDQCWYQAGVPELGRSPAAAADGLRDLLGTLAPSRVVLTGNSAGGFGAMRFGHLLAGTVDEVVAFSPQTCLRRSWRRRHRDRRWPDEVRSVHARTGPEADDIDARRWGRFTTPTRLHFAAGHRLDATHALRMAGRGLHLHPHPQRSHGLTRELRDTGTLERVLLAALDP